MREPGKEKQLPPFSEITWVAAIIAVVSAIVYPVVCSAAQEKSDSNATRCISNMKQLAIAALQYSEDYDGQLPPSYHGAPQTWAGRLFPYLATTTVYHCPDDPTDYDWSLKSAGCPVSYGINANLTGRKGRNSGIALADLESPSHTVLFFEVKNDVTQLTISDEGTEGYKETPPTLFVSPAGDGSGARPAYGYVGTDANPLEYATGKIGGRTEIVGKPRHHGGSDYAAVDGHVIWLPPYRVSGGTSNPSPHGAQDQPLGAAAGTGRHYALTFSTR